jgi:hypothetical protein
MVKTILLLVVSLLMVNCSDSSTNETELNKNFSEADINKEIEIRAGNSVILSDIGLIIKFKSVLGDSRCPIDAICVWEGNAEVSLDFKNSNGDTLSAKLNTSLAPKGIRFSNLTILLKDLVPYPKLDTVIDSTDYIVTLLITDKEQ